MSSKNRMSKIRKIVVDENDTSSDEENSNESPKRYIMTLPVIQPKYARKSCKSPVIDLSDNESISTIETVSINFDEEIKSNNISHLEENVNKLKIDVTSIEINNNVQQKFITENMVESTLLKQKILDLEREKQLLVEVVNDLNERFELVKRDITKIMEWKQELSKPKVVRGRGRPRKNEMNETVTSVTGSGINNN